MAISAGYRFIANQKIGSMWFQVAFAFHYMGIEKAGFFSVTNNKFSRSNYEVFCECNYTDGKMYWGVLAPEELLKGVSFFNEMSEAYDALIWKNSVSIFDIEPFEVVNSHQWQGHTPTEIFRKDGQGRAIYTEPARWEVATVNRKTGERIMLLVGHDRKDHMFKIASRMNIFLNHVRYVLEPWQERLQEHAKEGWRKIPEMPEELRDDWTDEMLKVFERNKSANVDWVWDT